MHSNQQESQTPKKRLLETSPFQTPSTGHLDDSLGHGSSGTEDSSLINKLELEKSGCVQQSHSSHYQLHKLDKTNNTHKHEHTEPEPLISTNTKSLQTEQTFSSDQQLVNSQHKKKKSKKHKECLKLVEWVETSPDLKHNQESVKGGLLHFFSSFFLFGLVWIQFVLCSSCIQFLLIWVAIDEFTEWNKCFGFNIYVCVCLHGTKLSH